MATEASHQAQLQAAVELIDNLLAVQTVPADTAAVEAASAGTLAAPKLSGAAAFRQRVAGAATSGAQLLAAVILDYVIEITGRPESDIQAAVDRLFVRFVAQSIFVESRGFTFATPGAFGSSKGELKRLTVDEDGFSLEAATPEIKWLTCVADQSSGSPRFAERFRISGEVRGVDILAVGGSGSVLLLEAKSAKDSLLANSTLASYSWTTAPVASTPATGVSGDTVTSWTLGNPANAQLDVDLFPFTLPGVSAPLSVRFTTNNSLTQKLSVSNLRINPSLPYQSGIWIYRESSCDGTLTATMGSQTQAFTVSGYSNTTWTWVSLDYDEDLWPANWLADQPAIAWTLTSRTTGTILLSHPFFGPMTAHDGTWYLLPAGTAPHALDDEVTWTDSISSDSKINKQIAYAFGRYLPHTPTTATITAAGGRTLTFAASGKTITASTGSWVADGFKVGMLLTVAGTSNNNGSKTLTAVSATVLTVSETVVDEGPLSATATIIGTPTITDPS